MNVLIVDDNEMNRKLLRVSLAAEGCNVLEATDGMEALKALDHGAVDAVISDILMPNLDGYRLCYEIRRSQRFGRLPFVFYTSSYTSGGDEKFARTLGANAFLRKPASARVIWQVLEEITSHMAAPAPAAASLEDAEVMREYGERLSRKVEEQHVELERRATELVEREARFSNIFEQASDGIFLLTANNRFIEVNPAGLAMLGYTRQELLGMCVAEVIVPGQRARVAMESQQMMAGRPHLAEWQALRKDGSTFPVETSARRLNDESYLAIVRDLTERKRAEEQLRQSEQQLRALAARLQSIREEESLRLSRTIHDELGQALTSINIDLVWLERQAATVGNAKARASMLERITRMEKLIENTVTTVQRISSELRPSVLDDLGLVEALEAHAEEFHERTGIQCRWICKPMRLQMDREHALAMFRIFQEILTNIIRHAEASEVHFRLAEAGGSATLEVTDNGKGIAPEQIVDPKSLGVVGMRERAMLASGEVQICNASPQGTRVIVRMPTH